MHHIEDINNVAEGMSKLIKDNGIIVTEDPSLLEMIRKILMTRYTQSICISGL